jgi:adenylate cyclase
MGLQSIETPKELWSATAYSIGVSVLFSLLLEISYLIGPRRFIRLIAGLYHAPREEERFVLFVDVAGSTGTAERLGDKRSHTMLDRVFSIATGPVLDFGGEIDQYIGDEMIVTWPAASGVRDGHALRCFLAMREAPAKASGSFEREFGHAPQVRGSLHFGAVVVGEVGDNRRDIVFHGDVMNTAARLEEASRHVSADSSCHGPPARDWVPSKGWASKVWERSARAGNLSLLKYSDCQLGNRPVLPWPRRWE